MPYDLARHGDVFVLTMDDGENRFNPTAIDAVNALLDDVERHPGPAALVVTGTGKFWSNGLDLAAVRDGSLELGALVAATQRLLARTLAFPRPTVAAINGHCFAAGAMWSLAHDVRVMRADRGYWCLPEVDLGMPFTAGMLALIRERLDPQIAHLAAVTGRRFGGFEAHASGIVDETAGADELLADAVDIAAEMAGKDPSTLGSIKATMYAATVELLGG